MKITIIKYLVGLAAYVASLLALLFIPTTQTVHYGSTPESETYSLRQMENTFLRTASPPRAVLWDVVGVRFLSIWGATGILFATLHAVQMKAAKRSVPPSQ